MRDGRRREREEKEKRDFAPDFLLHGLKKIKEDG
jgi:hypothetical protein